MRKTALHQSHIDLGAKMGEFAGYDMPLFYKEGVIKEHEWTRESCGLFDVSHMGQGHVKAPEGSNAALDYVQKLTPSSFENLGFFRTKYTVLLNEQGGIIDDLMIAKTAPHEFHFVINAGCKDKDIAWMKKQLPSGLEFKHYDDWALLALQGPKAEAVVREALGIDLSGLAYMGVWAKDDDTMFISRLGYTGEDGFEISLENKNAPALWNKLLAHDAVKPVGLAARDSLRLEMGYALYGHDIDETTSPVEADLTWVMGKQAKGYFGYDRISKELQNGPSRKRVGIKLLDKGVAREGAEIRDASDKKIGTLTSGGFSPSLKESIGMGYIETAHAKPGAKIFVNVRGRNIPAEISALPFVPAKTKTAKKQEAA
jgi:aminomethyltransferase